MSAKVFSPEKEKEETEKSVGRREGETIELYPPQGGLMVIHRDKCSDKVPGGNREKIFISKIEVFNDTLEDIAPIPNNMEVEMVKQWEEETDRINLRSRELEKSLGIALQTIKRLEEMRQAEQLGKTEEEQRKTFLEVGM